MWCEIGPLMVSPISQASAGKLHATRECQDEKPVPLGSVWFRENENPADELPLQRRFFCIPFLQRIVICDRLARRVVAFRDVACR
ncbi:MAG: hypothetical protein WDM80_18950 [Limisphaerales bacterium]